MAWMKPATVTCIGELTVSVKREEQILYFFHGYDPKGNQFEFKTNNLEAARQAIHMFEGLGYKIERDNKYGAPLHEECVGASNFELAGGEIMNHLAAREQRNS